MDSKTAYYKYEPLDRIGDGLATALFWASLWLLYNSDVNKTAMLIVAVASIVVTNLIRRRAKVW